MMPRRSQRSTGHDAERAIDGAQHAFEFVPAPYDEAGGRDHAIRALPARQLGRFFNAIDGNFRCTPEDRENGAILEEVDGVIAPLSSGDLAAVKAEYAIEFAPIEAHPACHGGGRSVRGLAPMKLARFGIAVIPATPPPRDGLTTFMIARDPRGGKGRWPATGETRSCDKMTSVPHTFVKGNIMLPDCRQARAPLKCEVRSLRARSARGLRIPQPPSPPEFRVDRARQTCGCQ